MKVCLLANGASIHTIRWANGLAAAGVNVVLVTQDGASAAIDPAVTIHRLPYSGELGYFRNIFALNAIIRLERPDLLNSHYASGYGTLARLSGFRPSVLSIWGSDVFVFPEKSPIHRWLIRTNLMSATRVASTSRAMAVRAQSVAPKLSNVAITPFGVDMDRFLPRSGNVSEKSAIVIGTVKTLAPFYGIDTLIDAFALLRQRFTSVSPHIAARLRLRLVGGGPELDVLKNRAELRGVSDVTEFTGQVSHDQVPAELACLDVFVALSRFESFGVAVIEAGACGVPVVVSNVGGLPEVVHDGVTGYVVPVDDPEAAAKAIERLVLDPALRGAMGLAARAYVDENYDWKENVRHMIDLYRIVIAATPS